MKRLAILFAVLLTPGVAHAACTNDLPQSGVMNVYMDGTSDAVVGGIGPNQCGLELTDFCVGSRCLAFFDGLSGYIDVTGLASNTIDLGPAVFEYEVSAVDGSLSFMGRTQPFELSGSDTIAIEPAADHVLLSLPDPLPKNIRMTSTGSSGWEATMPDWVGVPIPVSVYLDRLSAPNASLELFADHQMLKMDMRLKLTRVGSPPNTAGQPTPAPVAKQKSSCDKTFDLAVDVGQAGDQTQIDEFYAAVTTVGITDWEGRTESQCLDLLAALERAGIPKNAELSAPQASCEGLSTELRPILRGPDSANKQAVLSAMVALGVTSIDTSNPKHCAEISAALGR